MYTRNRNPNPVAIDIDETLVLRYPKKYPHLPTMVFNYYGMPKELAIHEEHVALLKSYKKRGFFIRVWSNNGDAWAVEVIEKLGLADFVDSIENKNVKFVDDLKADKVLGSRVYIKP